MKKFSRSNIIPSKIQNGKTFESGRKGERIKEPKYSTFHMQTIIHSRKKVSCRKI